MGAECYFVVTEKLLWLPFKEKPYIVGYKDAIKNGVENLVRNKISANERVVAFDDIEKFIYPSEDVRVGLFKRSGKRTIRLCRRSTGKCYDLCFNSSKLARKMYDTVTKAKYFVHKE